MAVAWTESMRLGTGVVNVFTRGPAVLAQHAAALQEASGGRFVLGIGSSSNVIVERWNGVAFERPRTRVRETVEFLRAALAGERATPAPVDGGGRAGRGGFRLEQPPPAPVPIVVAALRQRMLRTAESWQTGPFSTSCRCPRLSGWCPRCAPASEAGKEDGSCEVLCRFFCIQGDPEQTLPLASWMFAAYATVPVYEAFFRWLGYGSQIDPMVDAWREGDRPKAVEAVPRELVAEVFVLGDASAQRERIGEFRRRGIDTLVLLPIAPAAPGTTVSADFYGPVVESLAMP